MPARSHEFHFTTAKPTDLRQPDWWLAALIEDTILRDVLHAHAREFAPTVPLAGPPLPTTKPGEGLGEGAGAPTHPVRLWRFHHAVDDATGRKPGHLRLRLCVDTSAAEADLVEQAIRNHPFYSSLTAQDLIARDELRPPEDQPTETDDPSLLSAADDPWPPALCHAWPNFAHGASLMLLDLIAQLRGGDRPAPTTPMDQLRERYSLILAKIAGLWRFFGHDALLHQLNALFYYQPIGSAQTF
ncbi:MAG: hypothetical protein HXY24_11825 [Rubrivivax sp.]|nr:hypothetical protein [Rubrivivax sp.]